MKKAILDLLDKLNSIEYITPESIPNIDLYMEQITGFINEQLKLTKRHEDDKLLTKTMINNYTKNNLLPPPTKKKYSKEHLLSLILIYYLKNFLTIRDIQTVLNPVTDKYFGNKDGFNMEDIYQEIFTMEKEESNKLLKDFAKKYQIAKNTFTDFPEEDQDMLQTFSYICLLSFDIFLKKQMIEKMIDDVVSENDNSKKQ